MKDKKVNSIEDVEKKKKKDQSRSRNMSSWPNNPSDPTEWNRASHHRAETKLDQRGKMERQSILCHWPKSHGVFHDATQTEPDNNICACGFVLSVVFVGLFENRDCPGRGRGSRVGA